MAWCRTRFGTSRKRVKLRVALAYSRLSPRAVNATRSRCTWRNGQQSEHWYRLLEGYSSHLLSGSYPFNINDTGNVWRALSWYGMCGWWSGPIWLRWPPQMASWLLRQKLSEMAPDTKKLVWRRMSSLEFMTKDITKDFRWSDDRWSVEDDPAWNVEKSIKESTPDKIMACWPA